MDKITTCPEVGSKTTPGKRIRSSTSPSDLEKPGAKKTMITTARIASQDSGATAVPSVADGVVEVREAAANVDANVVMAPPAANQSIEDEAKGRSWRAYCSPDFLWPYIYRLVLVAIVLVMTGWWIAGLICHRNDLGWVIPFLVWLAIVTRILALHPPTRRRVGRIFRSLGSIFSTCREAGHRVMPERARRFSQQYSNVPLAVLTVVIIILGTYVPAESGNNTRADRSISLVGMVVFLSVFYATSRDRAKINYLAVLGGTAAQFVLGLLVLKTKAGYDVFEFIGEMAKKLLGYSADGTVFLTNKSVLSAGWFLIAVVPAVIFFVTFVQLLQYWGWIGWLVGHFATVFTYLLGISGAEAVVAAASPFIGQGESAVLIRHYIPRLTHAELHQIMTSGFATIAGSVMSAYMQMGISPVAIVSSCVMSIPASIALSKLRYPETEKPATRGQTPLRNDAYEEQANMEEGRPGLRRREGCYAAGHVVEEERPYNALHAVGLGSWLGLKIAGMIVASVLCIMALLGLADGLLSWWGTYINIPQLSIQLIMGYILYPVAFLLGVDRNNDGGSDLRKVAELLGIKIVVNEFVAYGDLTSDPQYSTLSPRSRVIAMYALCGFGNFSAVGIQIGALTQLAPGRSADVARVALSALITGIVATLTSANISGMLIGGDGLH